MPAEIQQLITLAQTLAGLGATGILGLMVLLWLTGRLFSANDKKEWTEAQQYREQLRLEAIADRKESDDRLSHAMETQRESNEIMRRSLDLNERLVEEFLVHPSTIRRRSTRDDGTAQ